MRNFFLLFFLFSIPLFLNGQVSFLSIPFQEALKVSAEKGSLIFLQFESATCSKCNEVADKAFANKELSGLLGQTFICLKINKDHPDRDMINNLYNIGDGFGSFFIDQNKTLVHSFLKTTTFANDYKNQIDIALTKAVEDTRLSELEKQYQEGNRSPGLLELLIQKRKSLNLETDFLLDEYVSILPADSLTSLSTLLFIAQMAPVIGGKPDTILRKDQELFHKVWYSLDLPVRMKINTKIIFKSRQKAVIQKDEKYAYHVAQFARSTFILPTSDAALQSYEYNMLFFYKGTGDTINYITRALSYYDNYSMHVTVDSIRNSDSLTQRQLFTKVDKIGVKKGDSVLMAKSIVFAPVTQTFSRDLNEGAWNVYKMTNDPICLQKALQWIQKANEFYETAEAMDTWARLLYKTGNTSAAILKEERAIALQNERGFNTSEFSQVLNKMKYGEVNID